MSDESSAELADFLRNIEHVRYEYARLGPGRVPKELADGLSERADALVRLLTVDAPDEIVTAVHDAAELATRCATRSEGLCFITGEAGLIPRRDLEDRFDMALEAMRCRIHDSRRLSGEVDDLPEPASNTEGQP